MNLVRKHQLCFNFLQSGPFTRQCTSDRNCQKCGKPHHTFLHSQLGHEDVVKTTGRETKQSLPAKTEDPSASHSSHLSCLHSGGQ